jgi:ABC-type polysaccharide/polyol phosphate transport system ATPase subunit
MNRFRESGKTIVLVSHDLPTVETFCDRVILLERGRIRREGGPAETVAAYRDGS